MWNLKYCTLKNANYKMLFINLNIINSNFKLLKLYALNFS